MALIAHDSQARLALPGGPARARGPLWRAACSVVLPALLALSGCLEEQRYQVHDQKVVMTPDLAPAFTTEEDEPVFRIDQGYLLHITPPTASELSKLSAEAQGKLLPFPRLPWVSLHDLDLQLDYAITNDSPAALVATVTLNGINEFVYYAPGPQNLHQWQRRIGLTPGQRVSGTVTELEMDEIAIDLATVVNGAPNSNLVVTFQSQSGRDPRIQQYIPKVIPGLVGVRAGIEVMGAADSMAPALTLEVWLRVQDHHDRACARGQTEWMLPAAAPFTPIAPVEVDK